MADRGRLGRVGLAVAVAGCLGAGLISCGDGDARPSAAEAKQGSAALKRALRVMQSKGTAAFTLTLKSDNVPRGQDGIDAEGSGIADFRHVRARYRIRYAEAPDVRPGTEIELFSEGSRDYARPAGQGRYQRQPTSLVANGPADSLRYLGTDSIDVHETGRASVAGRACTRYAGKLDYARIRKRAPASRRAEFDRQTHGVKTVPFTVCIDRVDVLREYAVEVRVPGGGDFVLRTVGRFTRVGSAPSLSALRRDERV